MDTSEKYILMCEKAEEVQEGWKINKGDWSHHPYRNETEMILTGIPVNGCHCELCIRIWLPRQDQLQEMVEDKIGGNHIATLSALVQSDLLNQAGLGHYVSSPNFYHSDSMEQLWLAFVMHEKYQKRWDEEKKEWQ